jgi:glutaredoxin-like YruB-family protein
MGKRRVIVFTQPDCLPCEAVKLFLRDRGVEFEEKNVFEGFAAVREMRQKYHSRSTPTVVVGDQVLIGFNPERLDQLLAK